MEPTNVVDESRFPKFAEEALEITSVDFLRDSIFN